MSSHPIFGRRAARSQAAARERSDIERTPPTSNNPSGGPYDLSVPKHSYIGGNNLRNAKGDHLCGRKGCGKPYGDPAHQ
jgi:hypothetical protein